jgi:exopolyphosphatase/guanosine-5'-triphosphate,3'-diphosphate pyrophosphatase
MRPAGGRVAVIDIGSNSIRFVVFDRLTRSPVTVHSEKASCGLGRDLARTGRLDQEAIACALANLPRFAAICEAMEVADVHALATAAVREAADGAEFVAEVERRCGLRVQIVSGMEEARLSALGVVAGDPEADGLMGDLGGASVELVAIDDGRPGRAALLALGPMQLLQESGGDIEAAAELLKRRFDPPDWFSEIAGRSFYAVGGAWRALAKIHIERTNYPLHVVHGYALRRREAEDLAASIARLGADEIRNLSRRVRDRAETLPFAALVLKRLLALTRPRRLVFSAFGLREGQVFSLLPEDERARDPLIAACEDLALYAGPFGIRGEELLAWTGALFPQEDPSDRRLRLAACLLSNIGWREHPDFRAEQAMERVLRMPVVGVDHRARVFLGLALFARYKGNIRSPLVRRVRGLVKAEEGERAVVIGRALRLAHTVSAGVPAALARTRLEQSRRELTLVLAPGAEGLAGDAVRKALASMAEILGRRPVIAAEAEAARAVTPGGRA